MTFYVRCIDNAGYTRDLTLNKVYLSLPDPFGERVGMVRIVDDTGEDYLYPADMFAPLKIPEASLE